MDSNILSDLLVRHETGQTWRQVDWGGRVETRPAGTHPPLPLVQ